MKWAFFVKNTRNLLETHSLSRINNASSRLTEKNFMNLPLHVGVSIITEQSQHYQ